MGNSSSSGRGHQEETVDYGYLSPQGVYTTPRDYNQAIVTQLICARKLAPFYRPLEEYNESWDDEHILAARKEFPDPEGTSDSSTSRAEITHKATHPKRSSLTRDHIKAEASIYRGAVECPICFLFYPPNINYSRCCDQEICTECFVQIKRAEPTTTHLVSEPAACPYCVQDNFGVVYTPPMWRAGIGSEAPSSWSDPLKCPQPADAPHSTHKRRQKSYSPESPEVVTTDQIRPDWEAKLAAVRAAVTRRANRRIIMRQVGDRLIPVGVTSGRVHAVTPEEGQNDGTDSSLSRRSRRRQQQNPEFNQMFGLAGQDLEELMVMEAMRLSLLDHEEHMRREAQNRNNNGNEGATTAGAETTSSSFLTVPGASNSPYPHVPSPSSSAPVSSTSSASSSLSSDEARSRLEPNSSAPTSNSRPFDPIEPIDTLQGPDSIIPWRRRASITTLPAAMSATATANTVFGSADLPSASIALPNSPITEPSAFAMLSSATRTNGVPNALTSFRSSQLVTQETTIPTPLATEQAKEAHSTKPQPTTNAADSVSATDTSLPVSTTPSGVVDRSD